MCIGATSTPSERVFSTAVTYVLAVVNICTCTVCLHVQLQKQDRFIADDLRHIDAFVNTDITFSKPLTQQMKLKLTGPND
ncbi:hypothetical protein ROHU_035443 [Labeo rohita]|uniref:Uncharacterized protein n=1 Tax=Labeo rohita TaxID=84645 RepID=A0A498LHC6_LABRO|nr:hypothetical protein ROHU_035443 [Labeo rohita]